MYAEITKEAYKQLVSINVEPTKIECLEDCHKVHYFVWGIVVVVINNYVSATTQYYVRDINA
tara:strand:- start:655 stop:840 length:186 start_codon:yes stop_codon:yes gene_type:complete